MLNKKFKILKYLMIAFWMYITPFTIFIVLCGSFYSTLSGIDNDLVSILGTTLALSVFAIPIFYAIYKAIKKRSFKKTFERKDNYEPKNEIDRQGYLKSLSYIPANYLWRRK
ncbi:hypothetical protein A3Q56_07789 [Intoshia linei]|uniref:Uncharacterized protein n=1 Tax=Intoshia linei TaxID=1819745 RepID=A0A177ASY7_9BILA|nr:hypothetical protein A3Q56_07789 [Intoshia linei]